MGKKVVEPEHFVYIVLTQTERGNNYEYDFPTFGEAEKLANQLSLPTKIIRARKATVLRFLERECERYRN